LFVSRGKESTESNKYRLLHQAKAPSRM
jgi:hypothetical protein